MRTDIFNNSPTAGSHDSNATNEELQAKMRHLEQRLIDAEEKLAAKSDEKPKKKLGKKIKKFFKTYIVPILDFIPRFLNAVASLKGTKKKYA